MKYIVLTLLLASAALAGPPDRAPVTWKASCASGIFNLATQTCLTSGGGGGVTGVTATSPIMSSGGSTPNISTTVGNLTGLNGVTVIGGTGAVFGAGTVVSIPSPLPSSLIPPLPYLPLAGGTMTGVINSDGISDSSGISTTGNLSVTGTSSLDNGLINTDGGGNFSARNISGWQGLFSYENASLGYGSPNVTVQTLDPSNYNSIAFSFNEGGTSFATLEGINGGYDGTLYFDSNLGGVGGNGFIFNSNGSQVGQIDTSGNLYLAGNNLSLSGTTVLNEVAGYTTLGVTYGVTTINGEGIVLNNAFGSTITTGSGSTLDLGDGGVSISYINSYYTDFLINVPYGDMGLNSQGNIGFGNDGAAAPTYINGSTGDINIANAVALSCGGLCYQDGSFIHNRFGGSDSFQGNTSFASGLTMNSGSGTAIDDTMGENIQFDPIGNQLTLNAGQNTIINANGEVQLNATSWGSSFTLNETFSMGDNVGNGIASQGNQTISVTAINGTNFNGGYGATSSVSSSTGTLDIPVAPVVAYQGSGVTSIRSIATPTIDGMVMYLTNQTGFAMTIQSLGAAPGGYSPIITPSAVNATVVNQGTAQFVYNGTNGTWMFVHN